MRSARLSGLCAASVLAALPFFLLGQAPAAVPDGRAMRPGMMGRGIMGVPGLAGLPSQLDEPIPGKPFTATAELSYGQGQTSTVHMARDAEGRTYLNATLPPRPQVSGADAGSNAANSAGQQVTVITDPVAHKQYTIFPNAKNIAVRTLRPVAGRRGAGRMGMGRGTTTTLGTQKIAGQEAQGLKTEMNVPARGNRPAMSMTREVWRSATLGVVLKAEMSGPGNRQMSFAVQTLKTGAPQAALFQLPAGYTLQAAPERGLLGRRGSRSGFRPTPPRG